MNYQKRGPDAIEGVHTRGQKKKEVNPVYELTLSRKDGEPLNLSQDRIIKIMRQLIEKREKRLAEEGAKRARESVHRDIEYLRTERQDLYVKFINGARLSDLLEIIAGERRLIRGIKSGALR